MVPGSISDFHMYTGATHKLVYTHITNTTHHIYYLSPYTHQKHIYNLPGSVSQVYHQVFGTQFLFLPAQQKTCKGQIILGKTLKKFLVFTIVTGLLCLLSLNSSPYTLPLLQA